MCLAYRFMWISMPVPVISSSHLCCQHCTHRPKRHCFFTKPPQGYTACIGTCCVHAAMAMMTASKSKLIALPYPLLHLQVKSASVRRNHY
jgi:hypothetical protein